MRWTKIFVDIGHFIVKATPVLQTAAPLVDMIPGVGSIFGLVMSSLMAAEAAFPQSGSGPQKKIVASSLINSMAPGVLQPDSLSLAIDNAVASLNALELSLSTSVPDPEPAKIDLTK